MTMCPMTEAALRALMHQSIALGAPRDIDDLVDAVKRYHVEPRIGVQTLEEQWREFRRLLSQFVLEYAPRSQRLRVHEGEWAVEIELESEERAERRREAFADDESNIPSPAPDNYDERRREVERQFVSGLWGAVDTRDPEFNAGWEEAAGENRIEVEKYTAGLKRSAAMGAALRRHWWGGEVARHRYRDLAGNFVFPRFSDVFSEAKRRGISIPRKEAEDMLAHARRGAPPEPEPTYEDEPPDPIPAVPPSNPIQRRRAPRFVQMGSRVGKTFDLPPGAGKTFRNVEIDTTPWLTAMALRRKLDPANVKMMVSPAREEEMREEARIKLRVLHAKSLRLGVLLTAKDAAVVLSLCGPAHSALDDRIQYRVEQERHVHLDKSEVRQLCDEIDYWQEHKGGITT